MTGHMKVHRLALALSVVVLLASLAVADVPTFLYDGRPYLDLVTLAADVKAKVDAKPNAVNAELRTGARVVRLTRNWAQIVVDGAPMVLEAPVRVKDGRWIVPKGIV